MVTFKSDLSNGAVCYPRGLFYWHVVIPGPEANIYQVKARLPPGVRWVSRAFRPLFTRQKPRQKPGFCRVKVGWWRSEHWRFLCSAAWLMPGFCQADCGFPAIRLAKGMALTRGFPGCQAGNRIRK